MTTTREQRLRELVSQWKRECMVFADMPNSVPVPKRLYLWNRIDELAAILAEPVEMRSVARIKDVDEYGPIIEWKTHWVELNGKELFTNG